MWHLVIGFVLGIIPCSIASRQQSVPGIYLLQFLSVRVAVVHWFMLSANNHFRLLQLVYLAAMWWCACIVSLICWIWSWELWTLTHQMSHLHNAVVCAMTSAPAGQFSWFHTNRFVQHLTGGGWFFFRNRQKESRLQPKRTRDLNPGDKPRRKSQPHRTQFGNRKTESSKPRGSQANQPDQTTDHEEKLTPRSYWNDPTEILPWRQGEQKKQPGTQELGARQNLGN
jgi:hypothetical protein